MRLGYTNKENDSCGGMSRRREAHEGVTDLDGEHVKLAEAIQ
jgi:hypothetical protein